MWTFQEGYSKHSYMYTQGVDALRAYILDMLNTDRGSRPYYPDYGFLLEKYKYTLLTLPLAQQIHSEVYFSISSLDGITIIRTNYKLRQEGKKLDMFFDLLLGQEPIGLHLTYNNGGFY